MKKLGDDVLDFDFLAILHDSVIDTFDMAKSINFMTNQVLKSTKIDGRKMVRREHDGISSAYWLVQKMIGEILIHGKIKW